ncbi:peroxiredoxin-like family protein [Amorphus coralli]|uniref:peroxiredoxin-like family protein n=1 Tax=Amorphus coralli TaxID=340680 RepID=UPI00036279E8|nr:peroxiredoxin-like family protein [Amorphus coralli]
MSDITPLLPRQPVPDLTLPLVGGGTWSLDANKGENFTLVVVYRGLHCPICKRYLGQLQSLLPEFEKRGVSVVAISTDDQEKAEQAKADWGLDQLSVAYGLDLATARKWGLYISSGRNKEPELFAEPGLFFVKPDGTLYFGSVQTMPFARPPLGDLPGALDFVIQNDYPARGEVETI